MEAIAQFGAVVRQALLLDPAVYQRVQSQPQGISYALAVVVLAGLSGLAGQSFTLFLNRVRPSRFGLALLISLGSYVAGYFIWTTTIWTLGSLLLGELQPYWAMAAAVGLAYAPQIFSFFEVIPFLGYGFWAGLSLWSMLAIVVAVEVGLGLPAWQALVLAAVGWLLLQALHRTVGVPVVRLQGYVQRHLAGVSLEIRPRDVTRVRRRPSRTWYEQLESWRRRPRTNPDETPPAQPKSPEGRTDG
jgi:hypothetical protein